jgi:PAS domain S-box-containing protein
MEAVLDTVALAIVVSDEQGRVLYANRRAGRLLGDRLEGGELVGAAIVDAVDSHDQAKLRAALDLALHSGGTTEWRHSLTSAEGVELWVDHTVAALVDAGGNIAGVVSTLADVTAGHEAEAAFDGSREFISAVLDTAGAFVVVLDSAGTLLRLNAAFSALGIDTERAVGSTIFHPDVVPVEYQQRVRAALDATLADESRPIEIELPLPTGGRRRVVWNTTAHRDPDGHVRTVVATGIDVTELRILQERLTQNERLDSLGRLTAGVAHDFGNTLGVVTMRLDRLRELGDPASTADLDAIDRTVDHARGLISDLMSFSHGQSRTAAPIDADVVVRRAVDDVRDLMRPEVRVGATFGAAGAQVSVDADGLRRALINLAVNADDAMPRGGVLSFRTVVVGMNALVRPAGLAQGQLPDGDYVEIAVTDTGVGIALEHRAKVFEPYFTTKPPSRGTGLGLATVYGTVVRSGGTIHVDSEVGVGTTFRMWLPLAGVATAQEVAAVRCVMVVDDDEEMRIAMAGLVRDLGFEVVSAADAAGARAAFDADIAGVVTDVFLPDGSGADLANEFGQLVPHLQVLFVSAASQAELVGRLPDRAEILSKPFTASQFRAAVIGCIGPATGGADPIDQ